MVAGVTASMTVMMVAMMTVLLVIMMVTTGAVIIAMVFEMMGMKLKGRREMGCVVIISASVLRSP
jgi:hypothetical protein